MDSTPVTIDVHKQSFGSEVIAFFVLRKLEQGTKKDGGIFYRMELGNRFGRVAAVLWDSPDDIFENYKIGSIVKIQGKVTEYKNSKQVTIEKIRLAKPDDNVVMEDFLQAYPGDSESLKQRFRVIIESIQNPYLKRLLDTLFSDDEIFIRFCKIPAGKLWHHVYLGGLLHHSVSLVTIGEAAVVIHPSINRDLLVTGALLHDIGKVFELDISAMVDYTDEGRLVGHIVEGAMYIGKHIDSIPDFPDELRLRLLHMILSHQGTHEQGAPVVPMTLEGIVLHYADELDSQANAFERVAEKEALPGKIWSEYVKLKDRYFYFGGRGEEE